jgi:hypothetical protein
MRHLTRKNLMPERQVKRGPHAPIAAIGLRQQIKYKQLHEAGIVPNRVTIDRWMKLPVDPFPAPVQQGPNSLLWFVDEVNAWVDRRRAERDKLVVARRACGARLAEARAAARAARAKAANPPVAAPTPTPAE